MRRWAALIALLSFPARAFAESALLEAPPVPRLPAPVPAARAAAAVSPVAVPGNALPSARALERALVARAAQGDETAFNRIYENNRRFVDSVVAVILHDPNNVPDATQETFLKAHRFFHQFRGDSSVKTWLGTTARNVALSMNVTGRRYEAEPLETQDSEDSKARPLEITFHDKSLSATPERLALDRALASLDEKYRVPFLMQQVEGLSIEEIARDLGLGVETAKSRIFRAKGMLREALGEKR